MRCEGDREDEMRAAEKNLEHHLHEVIIWTSDQYQVGDVEAAGSEARNLIQEVCWYERIAEFHVCSTVFE